MHSTLDDLAPETNTKHLRHTQGVQVRPQQVCDPCSEEKTHTLIYTPSFSSGHTNRRPQTSHFLTSAPCRQCMSAISSKQSGVELACLVMTLPCAV